MNKYTLLLGAAALALSSANAWAEASEEMSVDVTLLPAQDISEVENISFGKIAVFDNSSDVTVTMDPETGAIEDQEAVFASVGTPSLGKVKIRFGAGTPKLHFPDSVELADGVIFKPKYYDPQTGSDVREFTVGGDLEISSDVDVTSSLAGEKLEKTFTVSTFSE